MSTTRIIQKVETAGEVVVVTQKVLQKVQLVGGSGGAYVVGDPIGPITGADMFDLPSFVTTPPDNSILAGYLMNIASANTGQLPSYYFFSPSTASEPFAPVGFNPPFGNSADVGWTAPTFTGVSIDPPSMIYFAFDSDGGGLARWWSPDTDLSAWDPNTYAIIGLNPATRGTKTWVLETPGITGSSEPDWSAAEGGGLVLDGTCEWGEGSTSFALDGEFTFYPIYVIVPTA